MNPPPLRPKGPPSLSPGQRPGYAGRIRLRPVGPRYEWRNAPAYRAPLGRTNLLMAGDPARWAGLRNHGPLARTHAVVRITALSQTSAVAGIIAVARTHVIAGFTRLFQTLSANGASSLSPKKS